MSSVSLVTSEFPKRRMFKFQLIVPYLLDTQDYCTVYTSVDLFDPTVGSI